MMPLRTDEKQKNEQRIKRCTLAQQLHILTHAERKKNSWSIRLLYTRALKEMERAALRGERSHHYPCVQRNGSCKVQRRSVWLGCSISRDPSVLFFLTVLKDTLIMPLCGKSVQMLCTPGKGKPLQSKDHASDIEEIESGIHLKFTWLWKLSLPPVVVERVNNNYVTWKIFLSYMHKEFVSRPLVPLCSTEAHTWLISMHVTDKSQV